VSRGEAKILVEEHRIGEIADPASVDAIAAAIKRICMYSDSDYAAVGMRMKALATESFKEEESLWKILKGITGLSA
jgi:hypothetical protein